jgi:hypothetical protein
MIAVSVSLLRISVKPAVNKTIPEAITNGLLVPTLVDCSLVNLPILLFDDSVD